MMASVTNHQQQTTFGFESHDHAGTILIGLNQLRKRKLLFDVTLVVDGHRFPVHRAVLAACSEYFRAMFTDAMKERQQDEIQLNGVSALGLRHLLEYAYTSRLNLDIKNIQAVLSAASHLQIVPVIGACAKFLHSEIDLENCVDIATISDTFCLTHLSKHAFCFIGKHLAQLRYYPEFNRRLSAAQLQHLLSGDFPVGCSEAEVLEAVLSWIHFDFANRWQQYHKVLFDCVDFDEIPLADLVRVLYHQHQQPEGTISSVDDDDLPNQYWEALDELQAKSVKTRALSSSSESQLTEAVANGIVNIRGMEKAIVNIGGFLASTGITNTLTYLQSNSRVWHKLTAIPHLDQTDCGVTVLDNHIYILGGVFFDDNQESIHSYGFKYDPLTDEWTSIAGMNHDRCSFYLATVEREIYAIGGNPTGTCERYNPETNEWVDIDDVPVELDRYAGAVIGGNIYISGGNDFMDEEPVDSLWQYNVQTGNWTQKAQLTSPRADHDMVGHAGKLYIAGGWSKTLNGQRLLLHTVDVYTEHLDEWHTLTLLPNPRYFASLTLTHNKLHFIGGRTMFFHGASKAVDIFDLELEEWSVGDEYPVEIWEHQSCVVYIPLTREDTVYIRPSGGSKEKS